MIRQIDFSNKNELNMFNEITELVKSIIVEKEKNTNIISESERINQKIDYLDNKIDDLVFKIYSITKSEIEYIDSSLNDKNGA
jgi:hypothetical protein